MILVDCLQGLQQFASLRKRRAGGGRASAAVRHRPPPEAELERQRREIRAQNFRRCMCGERRLRSLRPEPIADPSLNAPHARGADPAACDTCR